MKKDRLSRRDKKIIRKGFSIKCKRTEMQNLNLFYLSVAYALQHGYKITFDNGDTIHLKKIGFEYIPINEDPFMYYDNEPCYEMKGAGKWKNQRSEKSSGKQSKN